MPFRPRDLAAVTSTAGILVVAVGIPRADRRRPPGAAVIDVGLHRVGTGLGGDVRFDSVLDLAGWVATVPGGVGSRVIAKLLSNTVAAAVSLVL